MFHSSRTLPCENESSGRYSVNMSQRCLVVVDSSASLPEDIAHQWGIEVVPLDVIIDGSPIPEGPGMTSENVLEALESGKPVTTSQPSVGTVLDAYRNAAKAGAEEIVSIHISEGVSGTVNTARIAAKESPIPVEVVDSRTLVMGLGYTALAAASLARKGAPLSDVAQEAKKVAESSSTYFTVDSLEYLKRGGRVPKVAAALGEALHIRPILGMVGGEVEILDRVRTTARAREWIVQKIDEKVAELSRPGVAVTGLRIPTYVDNVADWFLARYSTLAVMLGTSLSAALAVHGGPGSFAVSVADLPPDFA